MNLFTMSELSFKGAVVVFLAATGLYLAYLALRKETVGRAATGAAMVGAILLTSGLALRWIEAGIDHPPFTNLYESLLFFAWGIVVFYLVIERRYKFRSGGAFILPVALGAMGAAVLNPASSKDIQTLMPALQSHWLHAHVAIASIAYAAFVAACGTSLMFLIKDNVSRRWMGIAANLFLAFMVLISDRFNVLTHRVFTLNRVVEGQVAEDFVTLHRPGVLLLIAALYFLIAAALYYFRLDPGEEGEKDAGTILGIPFAPFVTLMATLFNLAGLGYLAYIAATDPGVALFGNPFKIIILCLVAFVGLAAFATDMALGRFREFLPPAEKLDNLSYVITTVAFPLMTMVIVTGMVWAKKAFGQYWQWDPKETASLITWIIYTLYLHARVVRDWPPRWTAAISILGFVSVVFTYLGVNAIGTGYHAYAGF
jgi:ABC-type transport system involved in cytochrome c biogenesis permease subunit